MLALYGEASINDLVARRNRALATALELYLVLGGSFAQVEASLAGKETTKPRRIDFIIGELMQELAAISHIHDIDVMQAAHNALDLGLREIASV